MFAVVDRGCLRNLKRQRCFLPKQGIVEQGRLLAAFDRLPEATGIARPRGVAEWGFQRVDAVAYARLLEAAYRRAKEADRTDELPESTSGMAWACLPRAEAQNSESQAR